MQSSISNYDEEIERQHHPENFEKVLEAELDEIDKREEFIKKHKIIPQHIKMLDNMPNKPLDSDEGREQILEMMGGAND